MSERSHGRAFAFRPVVTVAAAALLLLAGALTAGYQYRSGNIEHRRQLTTQATILAASVTAAIAFNDRATAQEYLNALMLDPGLDAAAVFNEAHREVAGFHRPGSEPIAANPVRSDGQLLVRAPARQGATMVGSVYLRAAPTPLTVQLARYSGVLLLTVMAMLMLFALGMAQRVLARANVELQQRARALAQANERLSAEMARRARTEEALRQSQKMEAIGQLSGGIAHDFNNLLMIIRGALTLLQKKLALHGPALECDAEVAQGPLATLSMAQNAPDRPIGQASSVAPSHDPRERQIRHYLDVAQGGVERAASLTRRLLTFARQQPLVSVALNLDALIDNIRPLLDHSVGANARIDYQLHSTWPVLCDANQMESAILNLVINARDAMPEGGRITLCTNDVHVDAVHPMSDLEEGDYVHLQVIDTGVGMGEEVRSKAFDPFFTTKPVGKGTGLGLSTILGYVVQSRGVARIDSEQGRGTTIHIILPRASADTLPSR
jgi:signal transduction histidine kinase